eukprot:CAMPEP_0204399994 /NCGR_PEP_ID=MMETSP0470-20130426/3810_1 /ASSEMBLY_ACC=CAM_ASM_000385 /TAXON_ID=2969 /ORGANISM="Oxyrrhis marina" /LENGTH=112 /DNA_ID=CAMNT_0051394817 /DNA_START=47 /DNA_END=386 /DNA_ORIENTATION=+
MSWQLAIQPRTTATYFLKRTPGHSAPKVEQSRRPPQPRAAHGGVRNWTNREEEAQFTTLLNLRENPLYRSGTSTAALEGAPLDTKLRFFGQQCHTSHHKTHTSLILEASACG